MKNEPNKTLERTRLLVTDHAFACSEPSYRVAQLRRYSALYLELYGIFNSDFIDLSLRDI